ncbi:extracellular solute-binding protein [Paenibacillus sp.]|uniref:extracellular solute-binding protein n=1 Tax=Paenibacillus sp. TaxID=58172 RepID=UPI002D3D1AF9|nr:extracellular solute-binding protein [Paenibacillus sp.]HZG57439.1 extracellular solute-binding protein [Paenibacillus sp.]
MATNTKKTLRLPLGLALSLLAFAAAAAGCAWDRGADEPSPPLGDAGAPAAEPVPPIAYSINTADDKLRWGTPITDVIEAKTGVRLEYELTIGEQFQRWDLWLAGNDYPDIVVLDPKYTARYKEAKAIIPLNDLIDKHGPNIKEKYGEYFNLLKDENGDIYSLYSVKNAQEAPADSSGNFIVQYDVLREAGYPLVRTFDELYELIRAYAERHPEIDGNETIGFGAYMHGWTMKHAFNNPVIFAKGYPDHGNYTIDATGEVQYNPVSEDTKTYYRFLNKLYLEGLFDREAFSMDERAFNAKVAQGRVLAAYAPSWMIGEAEKALRAAGKPERAYAHLPIYFEANAVDRSNAITPTSAGNFQWAISAKAKQPERIIQMIDFLFSDEGQILTQWGIEGEDYTVVGGKRTIDPELLERRRTDLNVDYERGFKSVATGDHMWFGIGHGARLGDGDYATPLTKDYVRASYDETTKEVLNAYGKQVWADFLPPVEKVPGFLWQLTPPADTKVEEQRMDDTWRKHVPNIVMAPNETEFEAAWSAFVAEEEAAGVDKANAAYTRLWRNFIETYRESMGE